MGLFVTAFNKTVDLFENVLSFLLGNSHPTPVPIPTPDPIPNPVPIDPRDKDAQDLLDRHNFERAKQGLPPLKLNTKLTLDARNHSDFQAKVGQMGHEGIGDGTPWTRISAVGYTSAYAGENVAYDQKDSSSVMEDWMSSPGHRDNILKREYVDFGGAVTDTGNGPYWTTVFASPGTSAARAIYFTYIHSSNPKETANGYLVPAFNSD